MKSMWDLGLRMHKNDCIATILMLTKSFILSMNLPMTTLTQLSLAPLLWDIGKQNSPRCDAAERDVPSGAILFAWKIFIEKLNKI